MVATHPYSQNPAKNGYFDMAFQPHGKLILIFLQISLFYADFDGISEKSTFRGYLISLNHQKFAKLAKISTIDVLRILVFNQKIAKQI